MQPRFHGLFTNFQRLRSFHCIHPLDVPKHKNQAIALGQRQDRSLEDPAKFCRVCLPLWTRTVICCHAHVPSGALKVGQRLHAIKSAATRQRLMNGDACQPSREFRPARKRLPPEPAPNVWPETS